MPVYVQYYFWLVATSLFVFLLERVSPWRREQKVFRMSSGAFFTRFAGGFNCICSGAQKGDES